MTVNIRPGSRKLGRLSMNTGLLWTYILEAQQSEPIRQ